MKICKVRQTVDCRRLQRVKLATKPNKACNRLFKHSHPLNLVGFQTDKGVCKCSKMHKPWRVLFIRSHYISMHDIAQIKQERRIKRHAWILRRAEFTNMLIHVCFMMAKVKQTRHEDRCLSLPILYRMYGYCTTVLLILWHAQVLGCVTCPWQDNYEMTDTGFIWLVNSTLQ